MDSCGEGVGVETAVFRSGEFRNSGVSEWRKHVQSVPVHVTRCGVTCKAKGYETSYAETQLLFFLLFFFLFVLETQLLIVGCNG